MIVVDTNVIVYFFLPGEKTKQAEDLYKRDSDWLVPYLWRSEFLNVMATHLRTGAMTQSAAMRITEEAERFFKGKEYFVDSKNIMACVDKSTCSAYDCEFLALAEQLNVPLVTADQKIVREFPSIARSLTRFVE